MVTPAGGLACHVDAMRFIDHVPQSEYPAGALAAAVYITSGIRGMERGSVSMDRDARRQRRAVRHGAAAPRRSAARLHHVALPVRGGPLAAGSTIIASMIGGLEFYEEPPVLRFFGGKMKTKGRLGRGAGGGVREGLRPGVLEPRRMPFCPTRDRIGLC